MDEFEVLICLPPIPFLCSAAVCPDWNPWLLQLIIINRVPVIFSLQPSSDSLDPTSIQFCRALVGFQGVASLMLTLAVQAILLLRGMWFILSMRKFDEHSFVFLVEALYQKKLRLQLVLRALYIGEIVATTVVIAIAMPEIRYGAHCVVTYIPIKFLTTCLWVSFTFVRPLHPTNPIKHSLLPIAIEFIFFVLTMVKFYEAVREGWAQQPLIRRFLQDGIWAFALPFGLFFTYFAWRN